MTSNVNNKRIAKNTLLLYFRMVFLMVISLYTSRVVLNALGVNDFGIYSVVGGIVSILSFLNNSMAGATQRFLNVEMGKDCTDGLKKVFDTSQSIHLYLSLIVFVLAETIGLWFLNNAMTIPEERLYAANWVYQMSILSFMFTIMSVPYNAAIIAHEKMSAFAYISIVEALLKLCIVWVLLITPFDKLIVYAILIACVSITIRVIYTNYCSRHFEECKRFSLHFDNSYMKQMLGFSGWTVFGALGSISHTQGISIVVNMFFGVAVNAALGITQQVTNVVTQFVTGFMTALNPQIVKSYAASQLEQMHILLKRGCRIGIFLVALFSIPLIIETPAVLKLWLGNYPDYTVLFIRIVLLTNICNSFASPLATAKTATGNIKKYQIILTSIGWLHLPLAWLFFVKGAGPQYSMYIYIVLIIIMQLIRIYLVCSSIQLKIFSFINDVIVRSGIVLCISFTLSYATKSLLSQSVISMSIVILVSLLTTIVSMYCFGLTAEERKKTNSILYSKLKFLKS